VSPAQQVDPRPPREVRRPFTITVGGVAGTIALVVVVVICVRLGFWQVSRLAERRAINEQVAARLDAAPVADVAALEDTVGLFYRAATVSGVFDNERSIILPGRSHRGAPGVYLLTPLLLEGRSDGVLVNRGWVPSPDAATVDLAAFVVTDPLTLRGLVLPFPGRLQSMAPAERVTPSGNGGFRRVWFAVDEPALRQQFPYMLLPVSLQALPPATGEAEVPRYPMRLEPPPLDEGPHLGYALQWFSFAIIGIIGWFAMVLRDRSPSRIVAPPLGPSGGTRGSTPLTPPVIAFAVLVAGALCGAAGAAPAHGQLRPLDPMEWRIFDDRTRLVVGAGSNVLWDQPATLAGTRGRLLEAGTYSATLRSGSMAISLGGVAVWRLSGERVERPPAGMARAPNGRPRQDAGRAMAATLLRVSPAHWPADVVVRFGATIPTTSDQSGLERDRTDFFALLGTRYRRGRLTLSMENGVGINGTIHAEYPQSDVWTYAFGTAWDAGVVKGVAEVVGHQDGHRWVVLGNEDQRELRVGFDVGSSRWIRVRYVRGLSEYSPAHGVRLSAGTVVLRR
jgi:surfeit locus 1 family protein